MSSSMEMIGEALRIKARLRHPANAVADTGIDLKRLPRGFQFVADRKPQECVVQTIPIAGLEDEKIVPVVTIHRLSVREIANCAAEYYGISFMDLLGSKRTDKLVRPRHVAIYLAREMLSASYPEIARRLGGRDHTTAIHACRKIAAKIKTDMALAWDVARIEATLIARQGEAAVQ